ncbi:pilin N-terminal domain-containing protein [Finegoldia magna]|uniref:Cell wall surface anchor family protein n=1 Tax=Finegoldia magna (strain ATCC 29328 / DSM 20472 / WAL 2508) TaxID=334413 RepID=B0S004_FINM2|nr:pilin N-terminal domain-containing protein [Finegoldia magna]UEA71030.1 isopeptide-forming domain-containing fimbrial protein [Finegoldia magna]BAG07605.1 cell wall surface anchor family protein [Finegoldia magna ATCC 29328]
MKKRFLSLIIALAMMVGVFTPLIASAADETTKTVTLHKILMDKTTFGKFTEGTTGKDGTEYDGNKITNVKDFFAGKEAKEGSAKEIAGVFFAWQVKGKEFVYKTNSEGILVDKNNQVIEANIKDYDKLTTDELKAKAVVDHEQYIKGKLVDGVMTPDLDSNDAIQFTNDLKEAFGAKTGDEGVKFNTDKLKGTFLIQEIHEKSTYVDKDGKTLTDTKAVPVEITLPLVNEKGTVQDAHVYPKNTEEKPETHKDFTKEFTTEQPNGRTEDAKENAAAEPHNVGDVIDYTVTTKVPAKTKWKTAFWDDKMTEGLTFVTRKEAKNAIKETDKLYKKGLTVKYDGKEMDTKWYELDETENGFTLKLTDKGLEEIAKATEVKEIRLDYHAVLNEKAVVAIPESNDVTFHYGNNDNHGNTPVPNKPNDDGEMNVTKTWADGVPAAGEWAEFTLYNAQTGKKVGTVKFTTDANGTTTTYTPNDDYKATGSEKPQGPSKKTDGTANDKTTWKFTWTGLDKDIQYKVVEKNNMNETATYGKGANGEITITNNKWNNPEPINPNEPKVVTYGAKFVKTDTEGKRLQGAEFVVKNSENKFLTGTAVNRSDYKKAQDAFITAINAYNEKIKNGAISDKNKVTIDSKEYSSDADAKAAIKALETRRDMLWSATLKDMNGFTATEKNANGVLKLTSNELGQFEIAGLAPGKYTLVETKAPADFVDAEKATLEFEFEIKADGTISSTKMNPIDFGIKDDDTKNDNAKQVINKKVTIPQTGGIGTIIFTAIGLAIMASAVIAIKKRQATEAR